MTCRARPGCKKFVKKAPISGRFGKLLYLNLFPFHSHRSLFEKPLDLDIFKGDHLTQPITHNNLMLPRAIKAFPALLGFKDRTRSDRALVSKALVVGKRLSNNEFGDTGESSSSVHDKKMVQKLGAVNIFFDFFLGGKREISK